MAGPAVDGPLQYDAAAIASVGHSKRPGSTVAGRATVFVFPDLDTGNTTYKAEARKHPPRRRVRYGAWRRTGTRAAVSPTGPATP